MSNKLRSETSPYLLQHAENPVEWYPWGEEAFAKAKAEDKPVFLSIGYSTCHWCHVMAHESFEDEEVAELLNRHFVSIKVDREERPDIDSIYMSVCQAITGSGGWPTSIFMTPDQKPFFAGTYFPKTARGAMIGMTELLEIITDKWNTDRDTLLSQADKIVAVLNDRSASNANASADLPESAAELYKNTYDRKNGGFGASPKFPAPHNLIFLLEYYERSGDESCLEMAEHTLRQMYRGGLFDHIGFGFCRYSTDKRFLVPHFEKMLYDNALLILAYCKAYEVTKKSLYLMIAEKTASYIMREMRSPDGGFYSAQDADSDGEEGKYYLLAPDEIVAILGERDANAFCRNFGIVEGGNFEGKSIPNLLESDPEDTSLDILLPKINDYRRSRSYLHLDDKILTSWNSLMIAAMCALYRVSENKTYLIAAENADRFIRENLCDKDTLFVSFRAGKRGAKGFLDDYASYIFARLALYGATLDREYLSRAERLTKKVISDFGDSTDGGFFMCGSENEEMILRPKESYDGALPSGNSLMTHNLVRLSQLTSDESFADEAKRQLDFLSAESAHYPAGYAVFLSALQNYFDPSPKATVVLADPADVDALPLAFSSDAAVTVLSEPTPEFPLKNGKTTYYVCRDHRCLPPVNDLSELASDAVLT